MSNTVPALHKLPLEETNLIHSAARLFSIHQAMTEVLTNALEAEASEIDVVCNWKTQCFSISDNGHGICWEDFSKVGVVNCRGKKSRAGELAPRGQSLKLIGVLGQLMIISRSRAEFETWSKVVIDGKVIQSGVQLSARDYPGTTVVVKGFLSKLPVRQKRNLQLRTTRALLELREHFLKTLVPFPHVQFTFRDQEDGRTLLSLHKGRRFGCILKHLFPDFTQFLNKVKAFEDGRKIQGSVVSPGVSYNLPLTAQYLYINQRAVECTQIQEMIAELCSLACKVVNKDKTQQAIRPVFLLCLETQTDLLEFRVDLEKTNLNLKKPDALLQFVKRAIIEAWTEHLPKHLSKRLLVLNRDPLSREHLEPERFRDLPKKPSCLLLPVLTSRNRSLLSVQFSPSKEVEISVDRMEVQTNITPLKRASENAEIRRFMSCPPHYKKIRRSVHLNPSFSLKTQEDTPHLSPPPLSPHKEYQVLPGLVKVSKPQSDEQSIQFRFPEIFKPWKRFSDDEALEMEALDGARIIGCLDKKFILLKEQKRIIAIDQHAADERIRLESLTEQVLESLSEGFASQVLHPFSFSLTLQEQEIFEAYEKTIASWGWIGKINKAEGVLQLTHQPRVLGTVFSPTDLKVYLYYLDDSKDKDLLPPCVDRLLRSKACHQAVKFGDELSSEEQRRILNELFCSRYWFICAHGRPTSSIICCEI